MRSLREPRLREPRLDERLRRTTRSGRIITEIDGLRFIAIAPVLAHHLAQRVERAQGARIVDGGIDQWLLDAIPSGRLGVELFFIISGFIICLPYATASAGRRDGRFPLRYGAYMRRRLTRLEPPYLVVMTVCLLGALMLTGLGVDTLTDTAGGFNNESVPLGQSYAASLIYQHGLIFQEQPRLNPPAWSLEIEFQFYVLAPFLALAITSTGRRLRRRGSAGVQSLRAAIPELVVLVTGVVALKTAAHHLLGPDLQRFLVTNYIEFFALGFVFARLQSLGKLEVPVRPAVASLMFGLGLVVMAIADRARDPEEPSYLGLASLALLVGMGLVFIGAMTGGVGRRFTRLRWISIIGGMCYTTYLIHLLYFQVGVSLLSRALPSMSFTAAMAVNGMLLVPSLLAVCAVFFVLVEKPCMDPQWPSRARAWLRSFGGREQPRR